MGQAGAAVALHPLQLQRHSQPRPRGRILRGDLAASARCSAVGVSSLSVSDCSACARTRHDFQHPSDDMVLTFLPSLSTAVHLVESGVDKVEPRFMSWSFDKISSKCRKKRKGT